VRPDLPTSRSIIPRVETCVRARSAVIARRSKRPIIPGWDTNRRRGAQWDSLAGRGVMKMTRDGCQRGLTIDNSARSARGHMPEASLARVCACTRARARQRGGFSILSLDGSIERKRFLLLARPPTRANRSPSCRARPAESRFAPAFPYRCICARCGKIANDTTNRYDCLLRDDAEEILRADTRPHDTRDMSTNRIPGRSINVPRDATWTLGLGERPCAM